MKKIVQRQIITINRSAEGGLAELTVFRVNS